MRPPVAAHGWPTASELPFTFTRSQSIGSVRVPFQPVSHAATLAKDLAGERLVDLEQIHVAHSNLRTLEHARHGDGGCHEQSLARVKCGVLDRADEREWLAAVGSRALLAHQQHRARAVGDG